MNRKALILLDKTVVRLLFWPLACWAWVRPAPSRGRTVETDDDATFLVIRPGGLGDGIMAGPFLRALREAHPGAHVTVACVKKNRAALNALPFHDQLVTIDDPRSALAVFRRSYEVVFDLEPFRKLSSVVAFLTGTPVRVGFDTNQRRRLYTHVVTYQHDRSFEAANCARQLRTVGLDVPERACADLAFELPGEVRSRASRMLGIGDSAPSHELLVAVAPGVLKPQHRWSMAKWAAVIRSILADEETANVVLIGVPADRSDADEVLRRLGPHDRVIDLVGRTTYLEALAVLEHCRVLLACDGGAVYMGAAMGCATVSLWGPGVMERFKPPGEQHVGVRRDYPCIPCVTWDRLGEFPRCPYGRKCYGDMTAAEVFSAYLRARRQKAEASGPPRAK